MVLTDQDQTEFIKATGGRMEQIRNVIPQIETADEAISYVLGSSQTLKYLSEKFLSPDVSKDLDEFIDFQVECIKDFIEKHPFSE